MNKIFNYCILSLLSVLTLTLGSCTEEYDYVAQKAKGQQVYFSNSLASSVTIADNGAHFIVPINRIDTAEELTVNLTATDESGTLTIPSTVTFKAGESEANITIDYDPSQIEPDTYYDVTLALADADYTTPYGDSNYSFNIVMWPPYTVIGTGKFTDAYIGINNIDVEIRQINSDPNRFRVMRPYDMLSGTTGPDFLQFEILEVGDTYPNGTPVSEADMVYFDETDLGSDIFGLGYNTWIWHPSLLTVGGVPGNVTHNRVIAYQDNGLPGVVQLAPFYIEPNQMMGNSQADYDGVITITFPDYVYNPKDYSVSVNYLGAFVSQDGNNYAMGNVTMGEDVNEVRVGIVEGSDVNNALNQVLGGQVDMTTVTASGEVRIPCSYSGECTMVAVAYAYNDEGVLAEQNIAYTTFNFAIGASQWKSLGTGLYTDHIFILNLTDAQTGEPVPPVTYPVEVQENTETPGVYRVVTPYAPGIYGYEGEFGYDESQAYSITIDAHDPDAVFIQGQPMGFYDNGDAMLICTVGGLNYDYIYPQYGEQTFDVLKAEGLLNGSLVNGTITFDAGELLWSFASMYGDGMAGQANANEATQVLVLPDAVTQQAMDRANKSMAAARMANVSFKGNGMKQKVSSAVKKDIKFKAVKKFTLNPAVKLNRK